jgi:hypothetical protein
MAQIILDSNNNLIQGDFDNATLNNRTKLQTTTTNATTNVYVVPNGSSTSAGVSVANNSSLTNASKIVMATNGTTDTQIISGVNGSGTYLPLSFYTNNALAGQFTTAGLLSLPGGGITFPATQVPSADANTLDDYEEGTWSPTLTGSSGSATYFERSGTYTKIGNMVTLNMWIYAQTKNTLSGDLSITLPITTGGTATRPSVFMKASGMTITGSIAGFVNSNSTTYNLQITNNGASGGNLNASALPSSVFELYGILSYSIA